MNLVKITESGVMKLLLGRLFHILCATFCRDPRKSTKKMLVKVESGSVQFVIKNKEEEKVVKEGIKESIKTTNKYNKMAY